MNKTELISRLVSGPAHGAFDTGVAIVDETLWLPAVKGGTFFEGAVESCRMADPISISSLGNSDPNTPLFEIPSGCTNILVEDAEGPLTRVANTLRVYEPFTFTYTEGYPFAVTGYLGIVTGIVLDILNLNQVQFDENIGTGTYRLVEGSGCTQILTQASAGVVTYISNKPNLTINEFFYYSYGDTVKLNYKAPTVEVTRPDLSVDTFTEGSLMNNYTIDLSDVNATPGWYKLSYLVPRSYCISDAIYVNSDSREYTMHAEMGEWAIGGSNLAPYEAGDVGRFIVLNDTKSSVAYIQVIHDNDSVFRDSRRTYPGMITVRAIDALGNPLAGVSITAAISGATVLPAPSNQTSVTDSNGTMAFSVSRTGWDSVMTITGTYTYYESSGTYSVPIDTYDKPSVAPAVLARPARGIYSINRMAQKVRVTPILNTAPLVIGNYTSDINGQLVKIYDVSYSFEIDGGIILDIQKNLVDSTEYVFVNGPVTTVSFENGTMDVSYKRTDSPCYLTVTGMLKLSSNSQFVYTYKETLSV